MVMERLDALVIADRILALDGDGPWLIGPAAHRGSALALGGKDGARRVRVTRCGDEVELVDLDGEPLTQRGHRRARHRMALGHALVIGRTQVLAATMIGASTIRWRGMLATAPSSLEQLGDIARAAQAHAPVFVAGESGTGKELAARAIHDAGARGERPFVALNCAALPETLAESELFGVERGAYTGATRTRAGAFAQAHGGTLFLDEVGELQPSVQAKLLRALEAGEIQPVGSGRTLQVDVRIVAASWRDLEEDALRGRFRHDLLHRLCVLRVDLLPLRERKADILPLVHDMLRRHDASDLAPDPALAHRLREAPWRGNVRELRNCVLRAVATREPLSLIPRGGSERPRPRIAGGDDRLRALLSATLDHYGGNRKRAARALGVSRSTIYRWLDALGSRGDECAVR